MGLCEEACEGECGAEGAGCAHAEALAFGERGCGLDAGVVEGVCEEVFAGECGDWCWRGFSVECDGDFLGLGGCEGDGAGGSE